MTKSPCETLADLYHYFDQLAEQDVDSDTLFTSSYIRGFISLAASEYGDEQQPLSNSLADAVSIQLHQSRNELSPQDRVIVSEYWQKLRGNFS